MKKLKKVIPIITAFIIGISTTVTAATVFNSKDITYSSDKTEVTNVKESLDELYNKVGKCPDGFVCYERSMPISTVELGDYINMTPTSTSYTPPNELTGCTADVNCTQNILNPSELNLWRVIKKNDDETVELVSEYVSSKSVYFYGKTGYLNLVGGLNEIAAQYTDGKHVQSTRHIGYSDQIEKCNNFPSSYDYISECPPDDKYKIDMEQLKETIGTLVASDPSKKVWSYYVSSRYLIGLGHYGSYQSEFGREPYAITFAEGEAGKSTERGRSHPVRPIVTLKSDVKLKGGNGTSDSPYILE